MNRLFFLILFFTVILSVSVYPEVIEEIYVIVNEDIITKVDYERELRVFRDQAAKTGEKIDGRVGLLVMTNMINNLVIKQEAVRQGINITDTDVMNQRINPIMSQNKIKNIETFKEALVQQGIKYDYFFEKMKFSLYEENLMGRGVITVNEPTFDEIKNYYNTNREAYRIKSPVVRISHILMMKNASMTFKDVMDKKKKSEELLEKLKSGKLPFEQAVKENTEDERTKNVGGDLGYLELSEDESSARMPREFIDALKKIQKGQYAEIIQTQIGFHIVLCTDRQDKGYKAFEIASPEIKNKMFEQKQKEEFSKYLKNLYLKAHIDYKKKLAEL